LLAKKFMHVPYY